MELNEYSSHLHKRFCGSQKLQNKTMEIIKSVLPKDAD